MSGHDRFKPEEVREKVDDRAILVGVDRGGRSWPLEESLAELERLADTAGAVIVGTVVQKMHSPDSRTFVGKGKAEEIAELARSTAATTVVFDDDLT
ncbi:MAG: GTPase HflX, partial [Actinobacteria bacterium]|nr:GTPase HflX [Actinomycetota bacterium]